LGPHDDTFDVAYSTVELQFISIIRDEIIIVRETGENYQGSYVPWLFFILSFRLGPHDDTFNVALFHCWFAIYFDHSWRNDEIIIEWLIGFRATTLF